MTGHTDFKRVYKTVQTKTIFLEHRYFLLVFIFKFEHEYFWQCLSEDVYKIHYGNRCGGPGAWLG